MNIHINISDSVENPKKQESMSAATEVDALSTLDAGTPHESELEKSPYMKDFDGTVVDAGEPPAWLVDEIEGKKAASSHQNNHHEQEQDGGVASLN
ncbi:MAG: hypothetical protein ACLFQ0_16120 [Cyclobacteriaceae bacterium]